MGSTFHAIIENFGNPRSTTGAKMEDIDEKTLELCKSLWLEIKNSKTIDRKGELHVTGVNRSQTEDLYDKLAEWVQNFPLIDGLEFEMFPLTKSNKFDQPFEWVNKIDVPLGLSTAKSLDSKIVQTYKDHPYVNDNKFSLDVKLRIYHI